MELKITEKIWQTFQLQLQKGAWQDTFNTEILFTSKIYDIYNLLRHFIFCLLITQYEVRHSNINISSFISNFTFIKSRLLENSLCCS